MNPEILMALAMIAACVSVYALGRALLPKGVRVRIQPVRRSAAREAALSVAHFDLPLEVPPAVRLEVGPVAATHPRSVDRSHAEIKPRLSDPNREASGALTDLVPFSRSERGYAFQFRGGRR